MRKVDYPTAKVLQDLGYDGEYSHYIDDRGFYVAKGSLSAYDWHIPAPRLDDAAYFLRYKHGIHIAVLTEYSPIMTMYFAEIKHRPHYVVFRDVTHRQASYDLALEEAVTHAIEIIKNRKR